MRDVVLNLGTFPFHCLLVVGDKEFAQKVFLLQDQQTYQLDQFDWDMPHNGGRTYFLPCGDSFVWMKTDDVAMLTHELFHVTKHVLDKLETPLNDSTEEVYAYTLQHLVKQALANTELEQYKVEK